MKKTMSIFHKFVNHLWVFWSNIRWKKSERFYKEILEEDSHITTIKSMGEVVNRVYRKFKYTSDGADQLWDCITPPPQNYLHYVNGELKDDCDGWASIMHFILHYNNIESYVLSVEESWDGHCVCLFKLNDKWHINDYNDIHKGFDTPSEAIQNYNEHYAKVYNPKTPVCYNGIIKYNFEKGKFKLVDLNKLV